MNDDFSVPKYGVIIHPKKVSKNSKPNASKSELNDWLSSKPLRFILGTGSGYVFKDAFLVIDNQNRTALILKHDWVVWALTATNSGLIKASAYQHGKLIKDKQTSMIKGYFTVHTRGIRFSYLQSVASQLFPCKHTAMYSYVFVEPIKPKKATTSQSSGANSDRRAILIKKTSEE